MKQKTIMFSLIAFAATFAAVADVSAVCNGGFEDGLAGWVGGASMALDEAVAHDGRRSVRLTVTDPKRDSVYVTQMVPVKGGAIYDASCFVKTEDVREAEGHKESVGAGLIVEWADVNKKWLTSGKHACGGNCANCGACGGCSACGKCAAMKTARASESMPGR